MKTFVQCCALVIGVDLVAMGYADHRIWLTFVGAALLGVYNALVQK
jgi:hypothetical protein